MFGEPDENKMKPGDPINVTFNGYLREEQKPIEEIYLKESIIKNEKKCLIILLALPATI